jgi:hypothetical protein
MVLKDLKDAKNVVQIYKELFEARKKRVEVFKTTGVSLRINDGWAACPLPIEIGKPLMQEHYDKYIQRLEKELWDLGFTPDVEEPPQEKTT